MLNETQGVKIKKQTRPKPQEVGTVRITKDKIDFSKASSEGPSLFGFKMFKWFYTAYNFMLDFFYFNIEILILPNIDL